MDFYKIMIIEKKDGTLQVKPDWKVGRSSDLMTRGGSLTMARAMATRCCSPPEIWFGKASHRWMSPTISNAFAAFRRTSRRDAPMTLMANATFSNRVLLGKRPKS